MAIPHSRLSQPPWQSDPRGLGLHRVIFFKHSYDMDINDDGHMRFTNDIFKEAVRDFNDTEQSQWVIDNKIEV